MRSPYLMPLILLAGTTMMPRSVLQDMDGIEMLPGVMVRRKAFRNAAAQGRGVLDMAPSDPKAVEELRALVAALFDGEAKSE